ncbi:hypothetical protein BDW68DRAFT_164004 [Aspergillus falconensis]
MNRTTFALPEVIYGPFIGCKCPHTLLFDILFHARAFRNPNLTSKASFAVSLSAKVASNSWCQCTGTKAVGICLPEQN